MAIDDRVEEPLRKMLGHAIRHELDDLAVLAVAEGDEVYSASIALCTVVSAYITIDVCNRWPLEVDLRETARLAAQSETSLPVTEDDIHSFLSRVVFGFERLDEIFGDQEKIVKVPLFTTANLLLSFFPKGKHWFEYLDQIWDAVETADQTKSSVLPALMYRVHAEAAQAARQSAIQQ